MGTEGPRRLSEGSGNGMSCSRLTLVRCVNEGILFLSRTFSHSLLRGESRRVLAARNLAPPGLGVIWLRSRRAISESNVASRSRALEHVNSRASNVTAIRLDGI